MSGRDPAAVVDDVIDVIAASAPEIAGGLVGRREAVDERNPSGERAMAADVWADELLADRLGSVDGVGEYASEERASVLDCGTGLSVAVDPLDGSSNLQSNNPMGTVFGVHGAGVDLPAAGDHLRAAGYVLYGPTTTMVLARDGRVDEFEVTDAGRRRVAADRRLPEDPVVYGFGGRVPDWPADFRAYAREIEDELKLRYGGAMVADVNQVLVYGGTFGYPGLQSRPEGKLRLQFEGAPVAHVVETAGGASSDGERSLLAVEPDELHQRTPVHVGNDGLIERLEAALD